MDDPGRQVERVEEGAGVGVQKGKGGGRGRGTEGKSGSGRITMSRHLSKQFVTKFVNT